MSSHIQKLIAIFDFLDVNPCDECARKAEEKGEPNYSCPCPDLVRVSLK